MGKDADRVAKTLTSVTIGAGLIGISILCPPLGAAATTTYGIVGASMEVAGSLSNNDELKEVGEVITFGAGIGGLGCGAIAAFSPGTHAACAGCKGAPWGKKI
ncbi:30434_t:CDS:1 [Racocetra persica]|uniref:30434_t:CDS:1 n=1 Tax=Racocetra persica TaxID=160502 RepID=A0ACA9QIQ0_9GLOM|nr:30434_t:CDS:1 [Racocetra persica]